MKKFNYKKNLKMVGISFIIFVVVFVLIVFIKNNLDSNLKNTSDRLEPKVPKATDLLSRPEPAVPRPEDASSRPEPVVPKLKR